MFEKLDPSIKKATVIGGGMAGMLTTYRLVKDGYTVDLFEASGRLGGLIQTLQTPFGMAETAANTLPATPQVLRFFKDIGVNVLMAPADIGKGLIWRNGKAHRFPLKPHEILIAAFKALSVKSDGKEKSLTDWTTTHLSRAALDYLVDPVVHGIYGTNPDHLEIPTAFKTLLIPEGKTLFSHLWPLRKRPKRILIAPKDGMQEIVERLEDYFVKTGRVNIHFKFPPYTHPQTPNVILCVPAYALGQYLPHLKEAADKIVYSSMVTATVFVKKEYLPALPRSFGLLIPRKENSNVLGIIFTSVVFPNRIYNKDYESFTVMLKTMRDDDEAVKESINRALERFIGAMNAPSFYSITRWPKAIPAYNDNVRHFWNKAVTELPPGTLVFGNYTGDVSLRGMIETVLSD